MEYNKIISVGIYKYLTVYASTIGDMREQNSQRANRVKWSSDFFDFILQVKDSEYTSPICVYFLISGLYMCTIGGGLGVFSSWNMLSHLLPDDPGIVLSRLHPTFPTGEFLLELHFVETQAGQPLFPSWERS